MMDKAKLTEIRDVLLKLGSMARDPEVRDLVDAYWGMPKSQFDQKYPDFDFIFGSLRFWALPEAFAELV